MPIVKTNRFAWMAAVARGNIKKGITVPITQAHSSPSSPLAPSSHSPPLLHNLNHLNHLQSMAHIKLYSIFNFFINNK